MHRLCSTQAPWEKETRGRERRLSPMQICVPSPLRPRPLFTFHSDDWWLSKKMNRGSRVGLPSTASSRPSELDSRNARFVTLGRSGFDICSEKYIEGLIIVKIRIVFYFEFLGMYRYNLKINILYVKFLFKYKFFETFCDVMIFNLIWIPSIKNLKSTNVFFFRISENIGRYLSRFRIIW